MKKLLLLALLLGTSPGTLAAESAAGATIFGDQESAIGLYLLPWREEAPSDIDRPPRLLDADSLATDDARGRAERHESLLNYRRLSRERLR
jgi:hypothetical protein